MRYLDGAGIWCAMALVVGVFIWARYESNISVIAVGVAAILGLSVLFGRWLVRTRRPAAHA